MSRLVDQRVLTPVDPGVLTPSSHYATWVLPKRIMLFLYKKQMKIAVELKKMLSITLLSSALHPVYM